MNEYLEQNVSWLLTGVIQFISAFVAALIGGMLSKERRILSTIISGGLWYALLLLAGIVLFNGISGNVLGGLFSSITGTLCAVFILTRRKTAPFRKRKGRKNR